MILTALALGKLGFLAADEGIKNSPVLDSGSDEKVRSSFKI
jgi:hypothetical protein